MFNPQNRRYAYAEAALAMTMALSRIGHRLNSFKYDPDQPRVPAGSPEGGQWTSQDAQVEPAAGISPDDMDMSVQLFVSTFCKGSIRAEVPGQFWDKSVADVAKMAKDGDPAARTCMKLLSRGEYRK